MNSNTYMEELLQVCEIYLSLTEAEKEKIINSSSPLATLLFTNIPVEAKFALLKVSAKNLDNIENRELKEIFSWLIYFSSQIKAVQGDDWGAVLGVYIIHSVKVHMGYRLITQLAALSFVNLNLGTQIRKHLSSSFEEIVPVFLRTVFAITSMRDPIQIKSLLWISKNDDYPHAKFYRCCLKLRLGNLLTHSRENNPAFTINPYDAYSQGRALIKQAETAFLSFAFSKSEKHLYLSMIQVGAVRVPTPFECNADEAFILYPHEQEQRFLNMLDRICDEIPRR